MLYIGTWKIHESAKESCMTYFASMTPEDDQNESPGVTLHGRWSYAGTGSGTFVCSANDYKSVASWLYNWAPLATISIKPICDDNTAREILLKKSPDYQVDYSHVSDEPQDGETLFAINYKFLPGHKAEGQKTFAELTKEQDEADPGTCRPLGRWHDIGTGSGFAIAAATNEKDLYAWAANWAPICNCQFQPVLTDKQARKIITSKPGYETKLQQVMTSMAPPPSILQRIRSTLCSCL